MLKLTAANVLFFKLIAGQDSGNNGAALAVKNNDSGAPAASGKATKDYDVLFKILLIGDAGVGKTSLVMQWVDSVFTENYLATIGIDFKYVIVQA